MKNTRLAIVIVILLVGAFAFWRSRQSGVYQRPAASHNAGALGLVASGFDRQLSGVEKEIVSLAEEMPEDKYGFAPTQGEFKDVRNFGQQIKHVGDANFRFFAAMLEEESPSKGGENGPGSVKSKAEIVQYLKDSFAYGHKAMASIKDDNLTAEVKSPFGSNKSTRVGLAGAVIAHAFDHYGQCVVYMRMNGIVPPASRK